jgi:hypothetical protein
VEAKLAPVMRAGRRLLRLFESHPGYCHAALATPLGWRVFTRFCRGDTDLAAVLNRRSVRSALAVFAGSGVDRPA